MTESLITLDIPLDQDGKHWGNLAVPRSTNSAGWSVYYIPIVVIQNGPGPTAVLFGGNHGDEYEGPVTLMNLARKLTPDNIQGRVIAVPMLNRPAVAAGTRLSPLDGVNMNRAFPGEARDSITGKIAHFVSTTLLPLADLVVDIHSGGSSMHFLPSVNMHHMADKEQMSKMLSAGMAWGAPYVFVYRDVAGSGLLPSEAENMGIVTLGTEVGSKAQFSPATLQVTRDGVENVLRWADILTDGKKSDSSQPSPVVVGAEEADDYVMAPVSGIYEPFVDLGDSLNCGDPLGQIHNLENAAADPTPVRALTEGILMGRRSNPLTVQGECLATIVRPFQM